MIPGRPDVTRNEDARDEADHDDSPVIARARARAKAAWAASLREDDATNRAASEARLVATWPRPRVLPARAFVLGVAAAACMAVAAFAAVRQRGGATERESASGAGTSERSAAAAPLAASAPAASASSEALAAGGPSRAVQVRVVVTGACPDCRVDRASVEPGHRLATGRMLSVPRGSRVTLGFATGGALVDPASGIDVEGPAAATVGDEQSIELTQGSARFRALHEIVVTVPGARLVGSGATFSVVVDAHGEARVAVEKGHVVVTRRGSDEAHTVGAGGTMEIASVDVSAPPVRALGSAAAGGNASSASRAASAGANVNAAHGEGAADAVATARQRFHDGQVGEARAQLAALASSRDPGVARRASFTLAEIEMASGSAPDREQGRARLGELVSCPDVKLASDAATLLARSAATPALRAGVWARYLGTSPPGPYRHRAQLERADALFDAGRTAEANAVLAELRGAPLTDAQRRHLERLTFKARELP